MDKYLVGFFLGTVFSYLWFHKVGPVRGFSKILESELGGKSSADWSLRLDNKMKNLEQRFHRLEADFVNQAVQGGSTEAAKNCLPPGHRRGEVIQLWREGRSPEEITRSTGLAKGEVELIISLKDHSLKA
jgi:hypothetical protein